MKLIHILAASLTFSAALATAVKSRAAQSNDNITPPFDKIVAKTNKLAEGGADVSHVVIDPTPPPGYMLQSSDARDGIAVAGYYLANQFLTDYDLSACSDLCATRRSNKGLCKGFNVYRLLADSVPTAFNCVIFSEEPNTESYYRGSRGVTVDNSRLYNRVGRFGITDAGWIQSADVDFSADGHTVVNHDHNLKGSLVNKNGLKLIAGKTYTLSFDYRAIRGTGRIYSLFGLKWNDKKFGLVIRNDTNTQYVRSLTYQTPIATGSDFLEFYGGSKNGSWTISNFAMYPN